MPKGILLDRDGTLIDVVRDEETGAFHTAFHPSHVRMLSGAIEGLRLLQAEGYLLAIATNQPGPAKGQFSADAVLRTNRALVDTLAQAGISIAQVAVCMHHPQGGDGGDPSLVRECSCRKPRPGLLDSLVSELGLDRDGSWMVGDSAADGAAGHAAGLRSALVFASTRCELCPLRPRIPGSLPDSLSHLPEVHGPDLVTIARGILARG